MSKTMINLKTDRDIKIKAQKIAKEIGVPLSTVINAYLREFVRDKKVTFSIAPTVRPEVAKILQTASSDIKKGKNIFGPFQTGEEMDAFLDKA